MCCCMLMSETIVGLRNTFSKQKEAFVSMDLKVSLRKTMVMVCSGITKDGMSKSEVDPCGVCSLRVKANSVLRGQCGRCAGVNRVTPKFSTNVTHTKCNGNIEEAVEQEEKLCDEVETLRDFTYPGDRVSAGGGCEAAVTARARCGWVKFWKRCELLYGSRFPLKLKGAVCKSYVRPAILCGSEVRYLKEREMKILQTTERSMVRAMYR